MFTRIGILQDFFRRYRRNKAAVIGLALVTIFVLMALLAQVISPYDPFSIESASFLTPGSPGHIMGTDDLGRDVFSEVVFGSRVSLLVGFTSAAISTVLGILMGAVAGYYGGKIDDLLMRVTELFMVIPKFFLCLIIVALYGPSISNVVLAISILSWPDTARLVRAKYLSLRELEFVEAAKSVGSGSRRIIFGEILPNALGIVTVNASFQVASAIMIEAGLGFFGLGDANVISWGTLLQNAQPFLRSAWWMALFPGMFLLLCTLGLNLVGDGLNDYTNPKLRER